MRLRNALKLVSVMVVVLALGSSAAVWAATREPSDSQPISHAYATASTAWSAHVIGAPADEEGPGCVYFINHAEGWAGGFKGRLYHTTDGGANWKESHLTNRTLYVKQVQFVSKKRGWVLAEGWYAKGGYSYSDWRLYRTTDGGVTWKWLWTRRATPINEFQFVDANRGWFVGGHKVFTTSNRGAKLSDQHADKKIPAPLKLADLTGLRFVDTKHGWVCGGTADGFKKPIMLRTRDGGRTWRKVKSGLSEGIGDVWFVNRTTGYSTTSKGLFKTTNAGGKWSRIRHSSKEAYSAVQGFGVSDVRMIGGRAGLETVWTSSNGGKTWRTDRPASTGIYSNSTYSAMSFVDAHTGWVVGIVRETPDSGFEFCAMRTPALGLPTP